jgi:hypothetical protein
MLRNIGWRYLDNQQEFWVNKTHIAKISVKTKNGSSDINFISQENSGC